MTRIQLIEQAMRYIGARYVFNEKNYPALKGKSGEERRAFVVNHSLLHIMKSLRKLPHGLPTEYQLKQASNLDIWEKAINEAKELVKEAVIKMFINVVKLAEEEKVSVLELAQDVHNRRVFGHEFLANDRFKPINHALIWTMLPIGELAELLEDYDHTDKAIEKKELRDLIRLMLNDVFYLANDIGLTLEEIVRDLSQFMKSK